MRKKNKKKNRTLESGYDLRNSSKVSSSKQKMGLLFPPGEQWFVIKVFLNSKNHLTTEVGAIY